VPSAVRRPETPEPPGVQAVTGVDVCRRLRLQPPEGPPPERSWGRTPAASLPPALETRRRCAAPDPGFADVAGAPADAWPVRWVDAVEADAVATARCA